MKPLAEACGMKPPVHKWKSDDRAQLMAELDAAYFILYGIERDDVVFILTTFQGTRAKDAGDLFDADPSKVLNDAGRRIIEAYDAFK